jgi:hypothetical protein
MMDTTPTATGDDDTDALKQLTAMAERLRRDAPEMTPEQAFATVYSDPANAALAARERRQNRPSALPRIMG